jgi:hypothetical protein
VFLLNSRLGLVTAAPSRSFSFTITEHPFSRSYGVFLPSSLTRVLSRALGFSPCLPVSVCGTGTSNLARGFSWQFGIGDFGTTLPSPSHLKVPTERICLLCPLSAWTCSSNRTLHLSSCVTPSLERFDGGTGLSTSYPSPTPFGLGLGPGLPWADEPSPGILRLPAGRILTCLLAYLCQHSLFLTVHYSSRYSFCPLRTLPYHISRRSSDVGRLRSSDFGRQFFLTTYV